MNSPKPLHIDPLLAEISELLHRMQMCKTLAPFQWMAGDAIRKLQAYEKKLSEIPASPDWSK
jgi:hypothetical protein